jgi:hypothetical protein
METNWSMTADITPAEQLQQCIDFIAKVKHYLVKWKAPADMLVNLGLLMAQYSDGDPKQTAIDLMKLQNNTMWKVTPGYGTIPIPEPIKPFKPSRGRKRKNRTICQ